MPGDAHTQECGGGGQVAIMMGDVMSQTFHFLTKMQKLGLSLSGKKRQKLGLLLTGKKGKSLSHPTPDRAGFVDSLAAARTRKCISTTELFCTGLVWIAGLITGQ